MEKKLGRTLMHLACSHHIFKLILRSVVEIHWPVTVGPNVLIFKRFQQAWPGFNLSVFETALDDEFTAAILTESRDEILTFILNRLEVRLTARVYS